MADEAQSIRSLNWRELFPFINLFRAFRIAIHPSKIFLGFALLCLLYGGGRFLDWVWPSSQYALSDEIDLFQSFHYSHPSGSFEMTREAVRRDRAQAYAAMIEATQIAGGRQAYLDALSGKHRSLLQSSIVSERNRSINDANERFEKAVGEIDKMEDQAERSSARKAAVEVRTAAIADAQEQANSGIRTLYLDSPRPLFDTFFEYESRQFHNMIDSALSGNWLNGWLGATAPEPAFIEGRNGANAHLAGANPLGDMLMRQSMAAVGAGGAPMRVSSVGVLRSFDNFVFGGPGWLLRYHIVYFILYAAWFLVIWAIFGGAIARIAAVHVARDEKISIRQALRFGSAKLLSFVFAPLIPVIIILIAGVVVALGGLLLYVPYAGPIVVGLFFILALLAGFIITLVAVGTVSGFNLMYPTIAVEGSDSFDAISRSLSYVFARPWRMLFYTVASLIYGAVCFLFVRYFVYLMLLFTHFFAQWFLGGKAAYYWPQIWPTVSYDDLTYHVDYQALAWSEGVAATLIAMWVYMVISFLAAFAVSFYFSSNTLIYYLMRREVDATELDDVYIEDSEEDFGEPITAGPAAVVGSSPAGTTPPDVTPPA